MKKHILSLIVPALILALTISAITILPVTSHDTDLIVDKLEELNSKLEGEKPALQNKVNAVIHQVESGALNGALNKLQNDVRKSINDWVDDLEELVGRVDEIIDLIKEKLRRPKPDFEITTLPYRLDVIRGGFNTTIITITSLNDFSREVALSATTAARGVTIALNPTVIQMHPDTTADSTLMVNATQTATLGDYIIKVTGTSGKLKCGCLHTTKHSIMIHLRIIEGPPSPPPQKPDFTLTASPTTLIIEQGRSNTSIVTVASVHGFHEKVDLSVTSPPISGVNAKLYPQVVAPQPDVFAIAVLILEIASNATINTYNITVSGKSGSLQHSVIVTLVVTAPPVPPTPDFTINAAPETLTVEQGDTTSSTIIVTSLRGFDEMVELTFKPESISGVTLTLDPTRVVLSPASFETSRLKVEVASDATPGELEITITGISGALERAVTVSLNITIERRPPKIVSISRMPETPAYNDTVSMSANVVDFESGIGDVILTYSKNGVQEVVTMMLSAGLYRATIPAHSFGTVIRYRIEASDKAGNSAASERFAYDVVDPYQPTMGVPTWAPQDPIVNDNVVVNITVTEPEGASGVDQVILRYSNATAMFTIPMTDNHDGNWTAIIGNQTAAKVAFFVEAADKAGNEIESDIHEFNVTAPAFPLVWILAAIVILAAATGGGAYYVRRKRRKGEAATSVPSAAIKSIS
jgi:hypothetical protein